MGARSTLRRVVRAALTDRRRKCTLEQQARFVVDHLSLSDCRYESATGTLRCRWGGPEGARLALHVADKRRLNGDLMRGPGSLTRIGMDVFDRPNDAAVLLALEDIVRAAPADAGEPERLVHALLHMTVDARVQDRDGAERRGYPTTPAETPGRYEGWGVGVERIGGRWRLLINPRTAAAKLDRDLEFSGRTANQLVHLLAQHPGFRTQRFQGTGYRSCRWWMVDVEHLMGDRADST